MSARRWTTDQETELIALYAGGFPTKHVLSIYGGTKHGLLRMLKRRGVPIRKTGTPLNGTPWNADGNMRYLQSSSFRS